MRLNFSYFYLLFVMLTLSASAQAANNSPIGYWAANSPFFSGRPVAVIKTYLVDNKLCGVIVKVIPLNGTMPYSKGVAATGPVMMSAYQDAGNGKWVKGKIYEQITAKIYDSSAELSADGNRLTVKGFYGPFHRTAIWKRTGR